MSNDRDVQHATHTGHEYDGIVEYTNPMPKWWTQLFWLTAFFALGYVIWYNVGIYGTTTVDEYWTAENAVRAQRAKDAAAMDLSEAALGTMLSDPSSVQAGARLFATKCIACHGDKGQGLIGPNLTDRHWLWGDGSLMGIYKTVDEGVPAKGMLAWGRQLSPIELRQVVVFVGSMRGTNIPGKAPEGRDVAAVP